MKPTLPLSCISLLYALGVSTAQALPPTYNIQLSLVDETFNDNSETFTQFTGSIRYSKGLSRRSVLNLNADVYASKASDMRNNDSKGFLAEVIYNYIPSSGFRQPVYSLAIRQKTEVSDSFERDFSKTSVILADTVRIDDQLTLTAGLELANQSFDLTDRTLTDLFIHTDYHRSENLILYLNIRLQNEDTDNASSNTGSLTQSAARNEFAGGHLDTEQPHTDPGLLTTDASSGFDSKNTFITIGSNYSINSHQSIDLSYEWIRYDLSGSDKIRASIISLDYFYKF